MDKPQGLPQGTMTPMTGVLKQLAEKGYEGNYLIKNGLLHIGQDQDLDASEAIIKEVYRFEGMSNPADNSIVYAIECNNGDKGVIVDAYGVYQDQDTEAFIKKMKRQYDEAE